MLLGSVSGSYRKLTMGTPLLSLSSNKKAVRRLTGEF